MRPRGGGSAPRGCGHPNAPGPVSAADRQEDGRLMLAVGLAGVLGIWLGLVTWRALFGAPPAAPVRFSIVAAVSVVIHLRFHAAATAAPTIDAVALVLAGWTTFGMWCLWLRPPPRPGLTPR